jgi:glycosyltransferase involved in cell wall biosynthesis
MPTNVNFNPKVSVIMPTYNRADLIGKTISSILRQGFKDYELIIIDDGSTDDTEKIINGYSSPMIRYLKKRHAGPASARKYGLKRARGEYIAYCDDDCIYYPNHLQRLVSYLNQHPKIGMAYSDGLVCVPNGKPLLIGPDFDKRRLETLPFFMILNVMHRKECLGKAGLFDENLWHGEDWDMWLRISDLYPVSHLAGITTQHICHLYMPTLNASKNKATAIERIIKQRVYKAAKEGNLLNYINDCSIGVIRNLIAYENINYASRLANNFYRTIKNYQVLACLGLCCLAKGKYHRALVWFNKSLAELPKGRQKLDSWYTENILSVKTYLARTYYHLGKTSTAIKIYQDVLKIMPDNIEANVELSKCYIKYGLFKKALKALSCRLLHIKGCNATANNLLGYCYFKKKEYGRAVQEFENAVTLDPNVRIYRHNLATAYLHQGKHTKVRQDNNTKNMYRNISL